MGNPVYVSVRVLPTEPDRFQSEYAQPLQSHNAAHGVRVLAAEINPRVIEGPSEPGMCVILEFPSTEHFDAWYSAPEYQPLKQVRQETTDAASTQMLVLSGLGDR